MEIYSRPNFLNAESEKAEDDFQDLITQAQELGFDVEEPDPAITTQEVLKLLRETAPGRFGLVRAKLEAQGLSLESLPLNELLDKALGIDILFKFMGKTIAVDVASGKASTLINKKEKILSLQNIYKQLGVDHALVVRIRREITEDLLLDLLGKLEDEIVGGNENFYLEFRYNAPALS